MSLCPRCERMYCDHTASERGQTIKEMDRDLTPEEIQRWRARQDADLLLLAPNLRARLVPS